MLLKALLSLMILPLLWVVLVIVAKRKPALKSWHLASLKELGAADYPLNMTFEELEQKEIALFDSLQSEVFSKVEPADQDPYNRYHSGGASNPANVAKAYGFDKNYNLSYILEPVGEQKGAVLLAHGLTDSPYSMRGVAEVLHGEGYYVLVQRLPGHGTIPAALTTVNRAAWAAAVRWGAHHVRQKAGEGRHFYLGGYSTGGGVALNHCLNLVKKGEFDALPRKIFLLSPLIGVHPAAMATNWHKLYSFLPGLRKFKWMATSLEYDPFKYNSFPKNAADQSFLLGKDIQRNTADLKDRLDRLPPILTFQSVIDTTVQVKDLVWNLYAKLEGGRSELVFFDINRWAHLEDFIRSDFKEIFSELMLDTLAPAGYRLTLVTNRAPDSLAAVAKSKAPGASSFEPQVELGLSWEPNAYSQAHVSIPFRPEDPLYGDGRGATGLSLGALAPRGERGVLTLGLPGLMRLRHNSFFDYMAAKLREAVAD